MTCTTPDLTDCQTIQAACVTFETVLLFGAWRKITSHAVTRYGINVILIDEFGTEFVVNSGKMLYVLN
jgi:hypothetical protein